jgi:hypothetical protein
MAPASADLRRVLFREKSQANLVPRTAGVEGQHNLLEAFIPDAIPRGRTTPVPNIQYALYPSFLQHKFPVSMSASSVPFQASS